MLIKRLLLLLLLNYYIFIIIYLFIYLFFAEKKLKNVRLKGGVNLNAIFPPLDMALKEISRSCFKQSKNSMLIP